LKNDFYSLAKSMGNKEKKEKVMNSFV